MMNLGTLHCVLLDYRFDAQNFNVIYCTKIRSAQWPKKDDLISFWLCQELQMFQSVSVCLLQCSYNGQKSFKSPKYTLSFLFSHNSSLETSQLRFFQRVVNTLLSLILLHNSFYHLFSELLETFCVCKSKSHTDPTFERWGIQFKI